MTETLTTDDLTPYPLAAALHDADVDPALVVRVAQLEAAYGLVLTTVRTCAGTVQSFDDERSTLFATHA